MTRSNKIHFSRIGTIDQDADIRVAITIESQPVFGHKITLDQKNAGFESFELYCLKREDIAGHVRAGLGKVPKNAAAFVSGALTEFETEVASGL